MSARACQILYIDANVSDAQVATDTLRALQRDVSHVTSRDQALAYLRGLPPYSSPARPDIVLLDMNLPAGEGALLLGDLKSHETFRRIPVIVMGTGSKSESVSEAYDQFANCFFTKPHSREDFVQVLATLDEFWFTVAKLPQA